MNDIERDIICEQVCGEKPLDWKELLGGVNWGSVALFRENNNKNPRHICPESPVTGIGNSKEATRELSQVN